MSKVIEIGKLIERSSETCGNRPRIAGTRITVGRIATGASHICKKTQKLTIFVSCQLLVVNCSMLN
jgi:hypothetical protein